MPAVQPSAQSVTVLRGIVLALKAAPKEIRSDISRHTRETLNPIWREEIASRAGLSRVDNLIFGKGARIAAGNPSRAVAASSKRAIRKGTNPLKPDVHGRSFEFGTDAAAKPSEYPMRSHGKTVTVKRRTRAGLPARAPKGRVVYPAFAAMAPRMVSLWAQIIVRDINNALEGKK